jgi:hypothetical protein
MNHKNLIVLSIVLLVVMLAIMIIFIVSFIVFMSKGQPNTLVTSPQMVARATKTAVKPLYKTPVKKTTNKIIMPPKPRALSKGAITQPRKRIMYLPNGIPADMNLFEQPLAELYIDVMESQNLNAEDLCCLTHRQEPYMIITTGTENVVVVHEPAAPTTRVVKLSQPAWDVAIHEGNIYFLNENDHTMYSCGITSMMNNTTSNTLELAQVPGINNVRSIEAPYDTSCLHVMQDDRAVIFEAGRVRNILKPEPMVMGTSRDVSVNVTSDGAVVGDELIPDIDVCTLTHENKFYGISSAQNPWVTRVRSIDGSPVFFTVASKQSDLPSFLN